MLNFHIHAPTHKPVPIEDLRPTQIAVGLREVHEKAKALKDSEAKHIVPAVRGPKGRLYVIDHHHLCRAILLSGDKDVSVTVVLDLSALGREEFWPYIDCAGLCHPFDEFGVRKAYTDIPRRIADMTDDPFRSLAGALRRQGGYAKDAAPFSEFQWADFLRRRIERKQVENYFGMALSHAADLAKSQAASHLPGWCGPS